MMGDEFPVVMHVIKTKLMWLICVRLPNVTKESNNNKKKNILEFDFYIL